MSPENFVFWLNGYFELSKSSKLTDAQVQEIKNHLNVVLKKVTPEIPETTNDLNDLFSPLAPLEPSTVEPLITDDTTGGRRRCNFEEWVRSGIKLPEGTYC